MTSAAAPITTPTPSPPTAANPVLVGGATMIQMPRRSVTRFFIPLIDVLTLLFCIFLLMPMVRPAEGVSAAHDQERLRQLEEEVARLRKQGQTLTPQEEEELKRLRQL